MKILHVISRIYPDFNGGTEIHVRNLLGQLQEAKEAVVVFTQHIDRDTEKIYWQIERKSGIKTYSLCLPPQTTKMQWLRVSLFKELMLIKLYLKVLSKENPQIIHYHNLHGLCPLLPITGKLKNISQVFDFNDYWYLCPGANYLCHGSLGSCARECVWQRPSTLLETILMKLNQPWLKTAYGYLKVSIHRAFWAVILNHASVALLPNSERTRDIYVSSGIREKLMAVRPHGVSLNHPFHKKTSRRLFTVAYIGALNKVKGVGVLVSAFKKLPQKRLRLYLYGQNGFPGNSLNNLIAGDKRIKIFPPFNHQDIVKVFSSIDVLVEPSIWEETFCLVVQEALETKTPIIVSKIGAPPERVIEGLNGFLVKPGSISQLVKKIDYVRRNYKRIYPKLNFRLGRFSMRQETKQLIGLYNALAQHHPLVSMIFSQEKLKWISIN